MPAPYLTMRDIMAVYRIPPRTARRWAAADHWRRTGGNPRRYHGGDVQASYERHERGRLILARRARERRSEVPLEQDG